MKQVLHPLQKAGKWFKEQTQEKREVIFPIPVSSSIQYLKTAFASPIIISEGLFGGWYRYTGQIKETDIAVQFYITGRGIGFYEMKGKFYAHPEGAHLIMIVREEYTFLEYFLFIGIIILLITKQVDGLILIVVAFLILCYCIMLVRLSFAANSVMALIKQLLADKPSFYIVREE